MKSAKKTPTKKVKRKTSLAADAIDLQLALYRSMRDFAVTEEPRGITKRASSTRNKIDFKGKLPFVIQKHAASHLHYDFRLGWNGVLKSWACAKGPSYFPGDRRLAVQVEDHPIEYGGFEGIIPQGQYGGGTVMLWDQGTWEPQTGYTDVEASLRLGSLKFTMHGAKIKGNWTLVRMGGKAAEEKKPNWLLIKEHDNFERSKDDDQITVKDPNSTVTGRSLEQIAASKDHVWNSKGTARAQFISPSSIFPGFVNAPKEILPNFISPQLATLAIKPMTTGGWLHELKLDGYRIQARKQGSKVEMLTRKGLDWTQRMKPIGEAIAALPVKNCLIDGEIVVLADDGTTSFADLQAAFQEKIRKPLSYFVFDLLHLDGHNLRQLPLIERKRLLSDVLKNAPDLIRYSEHLESNGDVMFRKACELHAEGIISKRTDGCYISGRTSDWLKFKCIHEQEFVVGGFTLRSKVETGPHDVGALLLGYYDEGGNLIYAGRTGTGFTQKSHKTVRAQLENFKQVSCPFAKLRPEERRGAFWVEPTLIAQIRFATWTKDNLLRQASFQGFREDKPASEMRREDYLPKPRTSKQKDVSASSSRSRATATKTILPKAILKSIVPIRLTHPDKVLDLESGLTKQQLADYYWAIAPYMLPEIAGRPLSLVRCPEGSTKPCFFQKHTNSMLPAGVDSVDVPDKKTGKVEPYITLSTAEALAGLAQMGVLEVHPWGACNQDLEHPDRIIIDLDPDTTISWSTLGDAATTVRKQFKKLGLESFLKSTGGKGLHVVVPIEPHHDWATIKQFAHDFVLQIEAKSPKLYLTKMSKAARKDRIYLDYLRNERGATAVAAFSPRARADAPVSMPLTWAELKLSHAPRFLVADFPAWKNRLKRHAWKELSTLHQRLSD